jgi:environmental stress-induced protein Ves
LLFYSALEFNIIKVKALQEGLKLNGKHQILIYGEEVNTFYESTHTLKGKTEALLVTSKQTVSVINADKTKYIVLSRYQHSVQSHNMIVSNKSFERVEHFR